MDQHGYLAEGARIYISLTNERKNYILVMAHFLSLLHFPKFSSFF